ncbi:uncharacterized protein LOC111210391 [Brassica napus]|uniref:uncharacterized protein LOC111210391 n=1 Tax=Brassica napus TaxID=3708 RepID=UPI00207973D1|nr:uncharacterized protein LOC111210391 [Brassica napus]
MERVHRTLPPVPPNKTQTKRELDKAICKKAFDKITLEMPLSDAIRRSSSVNLMPHSVAISLGYNKFKPTKITLVLADRSVRLPAGVLDDVPIRINNCHVPTYFVVLKYRNEPKYPLILGRPFLATVGAIIEVKEGRTSLNMGNIPMTFDMDKLIKRPLTDK